ncbi:hypothetical protein HHI36_009496 [Cryptolaemus montrouzieri]|uniref:TOG domain-containing protein n=1 Tax=Cryptolaemus montrouzieri TaxID=559131 RepID=A0ABD2MGN1_9CUCU
MELTKKSNAFDDLSLALQEPEFIATFDSKNCKILFPLLFLYETQTRFRKGSRDALCTILENIREDIIRECLPQIAKGIGRMGAPYGVKLAITVMKRTHLAEELLSYLPFEGSRGREGSLQVIIAACRLFPSTDIDVNMSIRRALLTLSDRRRRIRLASLEALASLAQLGGNTIIFQTARELLVDGEELESVLRVTRARLSRRQLPMVDFDGNIRYTVPRDPAEIRWLSPGGTSNHSAPSLLHSLQRNNLFQEDNLVPLKNTNAAIIPLDVQEQKKLTQKRGVLRPVYCILPSPEESDEGPSIFYTDKYYTRRSILPPTEKIRCESQDRTKWRERGQARRFSTKYDIKKSFSSDQLYHNQTASLDYRANMTSTSSVSSGSECSSSNGSQGRTRWHGSGIPVLRPRGYWGSYADNLR